MNNLNDAEREALRIRKSVDPHFTELVQTSFSASDPTTMRVETQTFLIGDENDRRDMALLGYQFTRAGDGWQVTGPGLPKPHVVCAPFDTLEVTVGIP